MRPFSKVIGMSAHAYPVYAKKMLKTGTSGYITKNLPSVELLDAMKRVHRGEKYVCDEIKNILCGQLGNDLAANSIRALTNREIQVVEIY